MESSELYRWPPEVPGRYFVGLLLAQQNQQHREATRCLFCITPGLPHRSADTRGVEQTRTHLAAIVRSVFRFRYRRCSFSSAAESLTDKKAVGRCCYLSVFGCGLTAPRLVSSLLSLLLKAASGRTHAILLASVLGTARCM